MFLRAAALACATAMVAAPLVSAEEISRCEETSFRVYFSPGDTALDSTTMEMLDAAERNVAGCEYAELRVALDGASPHARQRGEAIATAAADRAWDAVHIQRRTDTRRVSHTNGPEYAEVTMSPEARANTAPLTGQTETGV